MRATGGVKQPQGSIRFGLCCMFRDQPIKFGITTETAVLNRCLRFRSRVLPPVLQFSGTESFMALEWVPGSLDGVTGRVQYPPPFEEMKRS